MRGKIPRNGTSSPACPYKPKRKTMTQRKVNSIRKRLQNMTRKELQNTFILLFSNEMNEQDYKDLNLATDSRIRINILYGLSRFEYLAK